MLTARLLLGAAPRAYAWPGAVARSRELQKEKKTAEKEVTKLGKDLTKLQKQYDALATKRAATSAFSASRFVARASY